MKALTHGACVCVCVCGKFGKRNGNIISTLALLMFTHDNVGHGLYTGLSEIHFKINYLRLSS
jgi:hypothetical protein